MARNLKRRLQAYSNLGIDFSLACRNMNEHVMDVITQAEDEGWQPELYDMFGMGDKAPNFKESQHEGMRKLCISELDELAPQLHKRFMVRVLTKPWDRKSIKKGVFLNERRKKKSDRHA